MKTPERNIIEPIARQTIKVFLPKFNTPHLRNVLLRCIRYICITRRSNIQGYIHFNTPLFHVWILCYGRDGIYTFEFNLFRELESTIHQTIRVVADNKNCCAGFLYDALYREPFWFQGIGNIKRDVR